MAVSEALIRSIIELELRAFCKISELSCAHVSC
jgi:hypothetical protein